MRPFRAGAATGTALLVFALAACAAPGGGEPGPAEPPAASGVALPDMTATECAVAGGPWSLDYGTFDTAYSLEFMALDATMASSGFVGDYIVDFWDDGRFRLSTGGYHVNTTLKQVDENGSFHEITAAAGAGAATAEWSEIDGEGAGITFIDWTTDIIPTPAAYDWGDTYTGTLPAWQLPGRTGALLECDEDGTGLWIRSTTPGYLDLHFLR